MSSSSGKPSRYGDPLDAARVLAPMWAGLEVVDVATAYAWALGHRPWDDV